MARKKGFTLIEILLAVAVVAVFFGLIFAFYRNAINKSKYVEAVATVANISKAEELTKMETGEYVAAANTQEVNERLGMDIEPRWFNYKVIGVTNDNFIVLAERIRDDIESGELVTDEIVVARNNSGPIAPENVNQSPPAGVDEGSGPPPNSSSPGGGGPGAGAPGGSDSGGTPSGQQSGGSPTGGGSDDSIRHPAQTPVPASLLDYLSQAALATERLALINDKDINIVYVNGEDYGVGEDTGAFWFAIEDCYTLDTHGDTVFVTGNTIFVNENATGSFSQQALACLITHEATHADYSYNPQEWIDATLLAHPELTTNDIHITEDTIDQEYNCNVAMLQLWDVIRDGPNTALDTYQEHFAEGEDEFKEWLKTFPSYSTLEDY